MTDTTIEWTQRPGTRGRSWNPVQGCSRISAGCMHCYAEKMAGRFAESGWSQGLIDLKTRKWSGKVRVAEHKMSEPLGWREPSTVFVNSMSDLFHDGFTNEEIAAVYGIMAACPQHTFIVLTKRAKRMRELYEWAARMRDCLSELQTYAYTALPEDDGKRALLARTRGAVWPLPNVWNGVSVENQDAADERIPELLRIPSAVRLLSCEPLIGAVDLERVCERLGPGSTSTGSCLEGDDGFGLNAARERIDWVIAGSESGGGARPCDVDWLRSLRDQCAAASVPFFLKQAVETTEIRHNKIGGIPPHWQHDAVRVGPGSKHKFQGGQSLYTIPYLDEVQHKAFPEVP